MKQTSVVFKNVVLAYVHIIEPSAPQGTKSEPKYSASILLDKQDAPNGALYMSALSAAKQEGVASKWGGKLPLVLELPLKDADIYRAEDESMRGKFYINAKRDPKFGRPQIVDGNLQPILDSSEIYSGMICNVAVNFYPFSTAGKNGVSASLECIQKVRDGERLSGGGITAKEAFSAIEPQGGVNPFGQ